MEAAKSVCQLLSELYQPGMKILDVGCGAGHYLRSFRQRIDPEIDYVGVDLTEHYIELARKAFQPEDRFVVGDANDLEFEDDHFDIVMCSNMIPNLSPPPDRAIGELIRVAKKHVLIRALFSGIQTIVKEVSDDDGAWVYNNMYPESTYRRIIGQTDPGMRVTITADDHWQPFDNRDAMGAPGTRILAGNQVSGQLLLDWRFILTHKCGDDSHK